MSAARQVSRAAAAPGAAARLPATAGGAEAPALAGQLAARLGNEWLPRVAWTLSRTGRAGLVGIALLVAAALFLVSTHLGIAAEVRALRADVAAARQRRARSAPATRAAGPAAALRALPSRDEMPAILRQLFENAAQARLAVDTGKYDVDATKGGVVRHHVAFPVTGPYPQIRAFIDATLATMPAVALSDLALARRSIGDGNVEAQIRMTVFTVPTGRTAQPGAGSASAVAAAASATVAPVSAPAAPGAAQRADLPRKALPRAEGARPNEAPPGPSHPSPLPASARVVTPTYAAALFAQHSWLVLPPPPPPAPPPPPPVATAPPFPYTFIGSYAPEGTPPVFFLARGDRVIDARVGDRLDGVYEFESATGGQLVFVYLPLNVRQSLAAGVAK